MRSATVLAAAAAVLPAVSAYPGAKIFQRQLNWGGGNSGFGKYFLLFYPYVYISRQNN